jgi:hypothetical protein
VRQKKSEGQASAVLTAWLAAFDSGGPEDGDEDAALHHDG